MAQWVMALATKSDNVPLAIFSLLSAINNPSLRPYFAAFSQDWTPVYTEDGLRQPASWTEQLLDSWTFHPETVIVGLAGPQPRPGRRGLSDVKECRKFEVWLNLENDPGDWKNGGVHSGTGIEALGTVRPLRVGNKLSTETQIPD
ncbi:hypothetical protein STEG23_020631 [Scotinomys teguina]